MHYSPLHLKNKLKNKYYGKDGNELEVLGLPGFDGRSRGVSVRRAERVVERLPVVDAICLTEGGGRGVCRGGVESWQRIVPRFRRRIKCGKPRKSRNGLRPRLDVPDIPGAMRRRCEKNAIVERIR